MKTLITGGRDFDDQVAVYYVLDYLDKGLSRGITCLVSGNCPTGADNLGEKWARDRNKQLLLYPAQWQMYGKRAGFLRNQQMLDLNPDIELAVAFPGNKGTADMVRRAEKAGVIVMDYTFWESMTESLRIEDKEYDS